MTIHPYRAVDPDVTITVANLEPGMLGWWDGDVEPAGEIVVSRASSQAERRCTVRHEWGHGQRGDRLAAADEWPDPSLLEIKDDNIVRRETARDMITLDALADALVWSQDETEVAEDLWVDIATLRDRLRTLTQAESDGLERLWREREALLPWE